MPNPTTPGIFTVLVRVTTAFDSMEEAGKANHVETRWLLEDRLAKMEAKVDKLVAVLSKVSA